MQQMFADLLPDQFINRVRPDMVRAAHRLPRQTRWAAAIVVGGRHMRPSLVRNAMAFQTASAAAQQKPEQPMFLVQIARAELLVALVPPLRAFEGLPIDERRYRDRNPLRGRPGDALPSRRSSVGGMDGRPHGAVVVQQPEVGFPAQDSMHRRLAPVLSAAGCWIPLPRKTPRDLPDGHPRVGVPREDLAHHFGLRVIDHQVSRRRVAARDAAVAVGDRVPENLPLPRTIELSAPIALGDLGALVLRNRPLDLQHQDRIRIIRRRRVEKDHRNAQPLELLEDQDLVSILAGQAVGGVYQHGLECAGLGPVPQPVELRAG
jgi:hypothetical protein